MLDDKDILKLIEAQKDIFPTRIDFEEFKNEMRKDFADILTAVDKYAEKADKYFQEFLMLAQKVDRHEKWLHQLAEKLGVKLEY